MEQKMNLMNTDLGLAQNRRGKSFPCRSLSDFFVCFLEKCFVVGSVIGSSLRGKSRGCFQAAGDNHEVTSWFGG